MATAYARAEIGGRREARMLRALLGIVVMLAALWGVVKLVLGVVEAAFHLLLVAAVLVGLYALVKTAASRRT